MRKSTNSQTQNTDLNQQIRTETQKKTYATATTMNTKPNRDQAIIIEAKEGILINDYLEGLLAITGPNDIRAASKITNQRICVYLASKEIATAITNEHKYINIKGQRLELRLLVKGNKKIIISNIPPIIPNDLIERELIKLNITPKSTITCMRIGTQNPLLSHVISFRRQFLMDPEDVEKIPGSILISYEEISYRIFFASEAATCYICKQTGHIAKQCPEQTEHNEIENNPINNNNNFPYIFTNTKTQYKPTGDNNKKTTTTEQIYSHSQMETEIIPEQKKQGITDNTRPTGSTGINITATTSAAAIITGIDSNYKNKRTRSNLSTKSQETNEENQEKTDELQEHKKPKKITQDEKPNETDARLRSVKSVIENHHTPLPLNYKQVKSLLENCQGENTIPTALEMTDDLNDILYMIETIYPHLENRNDKGKCTRIKNKIKLYLESEGKDDTHKHDRSITETTYSDISETDDNEIDNK